jgi:hypothetical protein
MGALGACGGSGSRIGFDGNDAAAPPPPTSDVDAGPPSGDTDASFFTGDVASPPTTDPVAEVYGQSSSTLYKLDPNTKAVTVVGPFDGCDSVIDIALDANSNLYATTWSGLWTVDRKTAKCTQIASGSYPNSLSFVPIGVLDPNSEVLVGYQGSTYVRIDSKSGSITQIGSIGGSYASSGDIVSVKDGPTYLTVTGPGCNDCLIQVDPKTGAMIKNHGAVHHAAVFGLAFWAGSVYGFDDQGELFEVEIQNGTLKTTPITFPNSPFGLSFWGAGSTTIAPVGPTK